MAPDWVKVWHDRSFRSRRAVGEDANVLTDLRDTLRVCARYDAGRYPVPDIPQWLAIVTNEAGFGRRFAAVARITVTNGPGPGRAAKPEPGGERG